MKKLLEAELVSIAHRILKLKGREDVDALLKEAQQVTQKLAVLKFYEDYKYMAEHDIPQDDFDKQLLDFSVETETKKTMAISDEEKFNQPVIKEEEDTSTNSFIEDSTTENIENQLAFISEVSEDPKSIGELLDSVVQHVENQEDFIEEEFTNEEEAFVDSSLEKEIATIDNDSSSSVGEEIDANSSRFFNEEPVVEVTHTSEKKLEDLFQDFVDFDFVKPEEKTLETEYPIQNVHEQEDESVDEPFVSETTKETEQRTVDFSLSFERNTAEGVDKKSTSLNDKLLGGVKIGLNDKIGFVKHLFDGSDEDFTRVISQLNTFTSHQEAVDFIEHVVKPDYNNWENKDDYANRFFGILERSY